MELVLKASNFLFCLNNLKKSVNYIVKLVLLIYTGIDNDATYVL